MVIAGFPVAKYVERDYRKGSQEGSMHSDASELVVEVPGARVESKLPDPARHWTARVDSNEAQTVPAISRQLTKQVGLFHVGLLLMSTRTAAVRV